MHDSSEPPIAAADLAGRSDFVIGDAHVSPSTRAVRGPGGEACVEPRIMQVLVTLAEAGGCVVTRDALFRRCWGSVYVGEDSLNRAIGEVRKLSRTIAGRSFAIETIPRTGYRLIAHGQASASPARPDGETSKPVTRRALLAAVPLAALGGALWTVFAGSNAARAEALIGQSEQAARSGLAEGDARSVDMLEAAIALRPGYARAWGKLALARCRLVEQASPQQTARLVLGVQDAARRALILDSRQIDAHGALALLPPYFGDWLAAERRMRAVLTLDPEHLPTRDALDFLLVAAGRAREGATDRRVIAAREPLHAGQQHRLIYANWILGQIGAADRAADRAIQLWPRHAGIWFGRLWTLAFTGRADRALAYFGDAAARPDLPPWMLATLKAALIGLESGRAADIAPAVERILADVSRGPSLAINAILLLNALGEIDRAFDVAHAYLLEKGPLIASVRWRPGQVSIDDQRRRKTNMLFVPVSAPMRADPRFAALVEQIGLSDYWRDARVTPDHQRGA